MRAKSSAPDSWANVDAASRRVSRSGRDAASTATASPLLGTHNGTAYYLLFNGILGDKRPLAGNVLNAVTFRQLPPHAGPKIVYGEACQWGPDRLRRENIEFRKIPNGLKIR